MPTTRMWYGPKVRQSSTRLSGVGYWRCCSKGAQSRGTQNAAAGGVTCTVPGRLHSALAVTKPWARRRCCPSKCGDGTVAVGAQTPRLQTASRGKLHARSKRLCPAASLGSVAQPLPAHRQHMWEATGTRRASQQPSSSAPPSTALGTCPAAAAAAAAAAARHNELNGCMLSGLAA